MTYNEKGDILASPEVPIETKYRFILSTHDWYYDYADDNDGEDNDQHSEEDEDDGGVFVPEHHGIW